MDKKIKSFIELFKKEKEKDLTVKELAIKINPKKWKKHNECSNLEK